MNQNRGQPQPKIQQQAKSPVVEDSDSSISDHSCESVKTYTADQVHGNMLPNANKPMSEQQALYKGIHREVRSKSTQNINQFKP